MRTNTTTSPFGLPRRESHDASRFYGSRLYEGIRGETPASYLENGIAQLDAIHCKSAERMDGLPAACGTKCPPSSMIQSCRL